MELLERYLQAVRFWLPRAQQDDIIAELSEDLQSQIDDKEHELGHSLSNDEVSAILKRCGSPILVASRYRSQTYLIGPVLFPIYGFVLKMVLLFILVPVFVFIVGPMNVVNSREWTLAIARTMGDMWNGAFIAAGTITLIFAILERTQEHLKALEKWDPRSLPPLQKKREQKPSRINGVCELAFGFLGVIWLLLVPHYPVLVLGPAAAILKASAVWQPFYVPILVLAIAGLLRAAISLAKPEWEWFPVASQLFTTVFALILVKLIIAATGATSGAPKPLVVLADSLQNSPQHASIAAVVNASILIGLVATWIGLCISVIVHSWKLLRSVRQKDSVAEHLAQFFVV